MPTNKTLYVSDLDGTLLTAETAVTKYTAEVLNALIEEGMAFSIATARTAVSVRDILKDIHLNIPVILMNGVALYDTVSRSYVSFEQIPKASLERTFHILEEYGKSGFLFMIEDGSSDVTAFYTNTDSPNAKAFMEERIRKYNKKFIHTGSFAEQLDRSIVYYSISDRKEALDPLYERLCGDDGINISYYQDVYNKGFRYLEISSSKASKCKAVNELKRRYGFTHTVAFGDNLNDLPLFEASDECYAVSNAVEEVKARADAVIDSSNNDGVAKQLKTIFRGR